MGKRLAHDRRGGLAVIDAEPSDDFGDANSIGCDVARELNCNVFAVLRSVGIIIGQPDPETQRRLHHSDEIGVNLLAESDAYREAGAERYIVLLCDIGPDKAGDVLRTPLPAAEAQIHSGVARFAEPWEVVAAAVSVPVPTFGDQLSVAYALHRDPCAVTPIREAQAWPN